MTAASLDVDAMAAALEATIRRYQRPPPAPPPGPGAQPGPATCADPACATWPPARLVDPDGYCATCGRHPHRHAPWCGHQAAINRGDTPDPRQPAHLHHSPISRYRSSPWPR